MSAVEGGLCPNCRGALMARSRAVPFCRPCDAAKGISRPAGQAALVHLRCGRCEYTEAVRGPAAPAVAAGGGA